MADETSTIGIDLGGTKTLGVLVVDGRVVEKSKRSTPRTGGPEAVIRNIVKVIEKIDPDGKARAIGIGAPGPVRPGTGILPAAPNLPGWDHEVAVGEIISEETGRPVVLDNDVNVGTLAEFVLGAGKDVNNMLGIFAGTGVGGGLILDGRLRQGPRGLAGEIGHTFVAFADLHKAAVGRGELEDYAGRAALEKRARARVEAGESSILLDGVSDGRLKSRAWAEAYDANDNLTRRLVNDAASALAASIASAITLLDLELVVLGGGMADRMGDNWLDMIAEEVAIRSFADMSAPVVAAQLGSVGGALGAALLVDEVAR